MISTRIVCRPFIGRAGELEHLLLRRRQAGEGHGGLVLVGGEPGIGKSRLVREFKERLNRHTATISSSACREFAQKPLGPILDVLEHIAKVRTSDLVGSTKSERFDLIAGAFERVAAKRTTVAILEDLHWADIDLVQVLLLLVRRAANERLLFVATYRDDELTPAHPLFKWFGQLVREPAVSVVTLSRFADRELDRLLVLALDGAVKLTPPVMRAIRDRADGNPFFAEELLRTAVDSHRAGLSAAPKALPLSLHALVAERLQECSQDERALLRHASLFGRDYCVADVCEIFGGTVASAQPLLDRLNELQLLDTVDAARGSYRFRHALTRDVVYGEMPEEVVRPLHLTIAQHLERSPGAADAPETLGHHLWEAGARERAAAYYERAGDAAMAVFAYDDAAAFYQRAGAWARAARALIFAGDLDSGLALYERAAELALALGDIAEVVRDRALMAGHLFDGERREAAIALLRATLPIARRGEPSLHVRLQTRLAMTLAREARLNEAWNELQAIDAAGLDPHSEFTGEYHLCTSELHALRGEREAWQARFSRGIAVYEALGHPGPLQVAHANFAVQALGLGETELARKHHRIACELARTLRFDDQAILRAQVEFYAGDLAQARRIVEATGTPSRYLIRATLMQVAVPLSIALGDDRMLEHYFDERLVAEAGPHPFTPTLARVAAAHALALASTNRRGEARMLLARVLESLNTTFGMTLPVVAIATLLPERAGELRPLLEAAAEPNGDRIGKALLAFVFGDPRDAAARFADIGWPLHDAR
jgi:tetratricopeptide (TPR) repeat protein